MRKKRLKQKINSILIPLTLLSYFQLYGQNHNTLEIELNWNNEKIKFLTGKITVSDSATNFFYGKSLICDREYNREFILKIPVSVNQKNVEYKIEINLNQFYPERIYFTSTELKKVRLFLNEYPICELRRIEKKNKNRKLNNKK